MIDYLDIIGFYCRAKVLTLHAIDYIFSRNILL